MDPLGHWLIVGGTQTGKTTLAKELASQYSAVGIPVVVCDPFGPAGWGARYWTKDIDDFLAFAHDPRVCLRCALFVDEGGMMLGGKNKWDNSYSWLTTTSRHHGHVSHVISNKGISVAPVLRENCSNLAVFNIHVDYAKELARDFNRDIILKANRLAKGWAIVTGRFRAPGFHSTPWAGAGPFQDEGDNP